MIRAAAVPLALSVLVAGCTCSEPAQLQGTVLDPWDNPVAGASVSTEWLDEPIVTSNKGTFSLPLVEGTQSLEITRDGFIANTHEIEVPSVDASIATTARLIPEPEIEGFHLIGPSSYLKLKGVPVSRTSDGMATVHGIPTAGDVEVSAGRVRGVYHTSLKLDEVHRLTIELHRLAYRDAAEVVTVDGRQKVDVNLWTTDGKVDIDRALLGSERNWMYQTDDLPPGTYAFVSRNLLDPTDQQAFDKTASAARMVHPFTVK